MHRRFAVIAAGLLAALSAATSLPASAATTRPAPGQGGYTSAQQLKAAEASALSYTVRRGDTLSAIAARLGMPLRSLEGRNPGIVLRHGSYDRIFPGDKLHLTGAIGPLLRAAAPVRTVTVTSHHYACGDGDGDGFDLPCSVLHHSSGFAPQSAPVSSGHVSPFGGSFEQCVISRESGGNSQVMNSTGHYGLFQFSASTWAAHGGNPADFGHASVGEQQAVFNATVAADGHSDWSPYDGC